MIRGALETVGLTEAEFAPVLSLFGLLAAIVWPTRRRRRRSGPPATGEVDINEPSDQEPLVDAGAPVAT